jgi:protocatechuate 3,4-dioxygenase beta subunit
MTGTKLTVTGYVLAHGDCRPVANAWVDFWQADHQGNYDNTAYRLRGHQFTDKAGIYYLETVLPGLYPGRTRHIHVKVRAPNGPILTTQLYFSGEGGNQGDGIFNPALVMTTHDGPEGKTARFTFVVNVR